MFEKIKRIFPDKNAEDVQDLTVVSGGSKQGNDSGGHPRYRVASCQSVGKVRTHNEDTTFILNSFLSGLNGGLSFGIYLVADGMGGHQSGEIASILAAQGVASCLIEKIFKSYLFEDKSVSDLEIKQLLNDAVKDAQSLILQRVPGGGTTLTLVLALDERLFSAHVGDSRLYVIGLDGTLTLKTKDHSLVRRLIDLGEITEAEAENHPQRNVLYRALGQTDALVPDIAQFEMKSGERLMLCSDGLWGMLPVDKIQEILTEFPNLDQAAGALVNAANEAGGLDNITVLLIQKISLKNHLRESKC